MPTFQNYFKIITPKSKATDYTVLATDSVNNNQMGGGAVANISWYSQIMKGAGSRMARYMQYDGMDTDIDVSRALDIIAEEISNDDVTTNLAFLIEYQNEGDEDISDTVVTTIRAAVRQWTKVQDLNNRIFRIARYLAKYGDCFFKKSKDTQKWEFLDPSKVYGIEIDGIGDKIAFHIRGTGAQSAYSLYGAKASQIDVVPSDAIVHFTLSDEMGESAPFGESILQPIFRTFKQLSALEDSVIIYRLVRAPERRVFYIDVGNMPAQRVKQYLESVKNELRQKRIPNTSSQGGEVVDGTFNPHCLDMNTRIPLLDGRTLSLYELEVEHNSGKENWVYSCDPITGKIAPGLISWAGKTRLNTEVIKLTLDNGEEIICTPDHKFPIQGKGFVEAQNLTTNDSFFPFLKKEEVLYGNVEYQKVFDNETKKWVWTHRMVSDFNKSNNISTEQLHDELYINDVKNVTHHIDFNRFNNAPNNLTMMGKRDHIKFHSDNKCEWWSNLSDKEYKEICNSISIGTKNAMSLIPDEVKQEYQQRQQQSIKEYHSKNKIAPTEEYIRWLEITKNNAKLWSQNPDILAKRSEHAKTVGYKFLPKNQQLNISQDMLSRVVDIVKLCDYKKGKTLEMLNEDKLFLQFYKDANLDDGKSNYKINVDKISSKFPLRLFAHTNVAGWKEFKNVVRNYNHKIVKIEKIENMDTGCITVDGNHIYHDYHTFAIEGGIFVKNSISEDIFLAQTAGGRGSRVETLPGGENLGELAELKYFRNKLYQGLRIPSSYMTGQDAQGAQYNDGKVGIAYIEELRFANFIRRIQNKLEVIFDQEFKKYLHEIGVAIDPNLFILRLPEPQNFGSYRQAALDADLINAYKSIADEKMLSSRFKLKRYLGLTEDEISMNEVMLKQELGIDESSSLSDIRQIYDSIQMDARKPVPVKPKVALPSVKPAAGGDEPAPDDGMGDMGMPDDGAPDEGGMGDLGNI
jgi:hypothetical protein